MALIYFVGLLTDRLLYKVRTQTRLTSFPISSCSVPVPYTIDHLKDHLIFLSHYFSGRLFTLNSQHKNQSSSTMMYSENRVRFADYAQLRVIKTSSNRSEKAYTRTELEEFKVKASFDAVRLRNFISKQIQRHESTGEALDHVMSRGIHDHLIGLENLVSEEASRRQARERKAHMSAVLDAQKLMQEKCNNVDSGKLAKFASMSSAKCVEAAYLRASWSDVVIPRGKSVEAPRTVHPSVAMRRNTVGVRRANSPAAQAA
jgi:hypothetical protein